MELRKVRASKHCTILRVSLGEFCACPYKAANSDLIEGDTITPLARRTWPSIPQNDEGGAAVDNDEGGAAV